MPGAASAFEAVGGVRTWWRPQPDHQRVATAWERRARRGTSSRCPVIFLDVDGVICCNEENILVGPQLRELRRIAEATGARVVLSTNWRRYASFKRRLLRTLHRARIGCIGSTPLLAEHLPVRPQEIIRWLRRYGSGVDGWVVLDDRDLLSEAGGAKLKNCFVKTCPRAGLTAWAADEAIRILGGGSVNRAKAAAPRARPQERAPAPCLPAATVTMGSKTLARTYPPKTPPFRPAALPGEAALPGYLPPASILRCDEELQPDCMLGLRCDGAAGESMLGLTRQATGLSVLEL